MQALLPVGSDTHGTIQEFLSTASDDSVQDAIRLVLDRLAALVPADILEPPEIMIPTEFLGQKRLSLRWCILFGSLGDLACNRSSQGAAFWNSLIRVISSPVVYHRVDIWGDSRTPDIESIHRDSKGDLWGQWLAAALLSGMMKQEQMACPSHVLDVIMRKFGAAGMSQMTLATASRIARDSMTADATQGCRIAVSIVVSIAVYGVACSQVGL